MRRILTPTLSIPFFVLVCTCLQARGAGLLAPTDLTLPPLRVTEHLVDVSIQDQVALTTLNQTFHNDTSRRLEATYVFPLPENAELTDFQMSFNGKMVEGNVLPADDARRIYESIVRQSKDPGLIEFIGRRLLQMRIFPIEPGSDTRIQVKYQQICKPIGGMNGYHYPLRTARAGGQAYGTVRFAVRLDTTAPLKNVWSPTHSVEIVRDGEYAAKIAYEASKGSLDDDFMLLYDTDDSDLGLSVIAYKPSQRRPGFFVLTLTPKQLWPKSDYQPQDVVFVIDTSGSMAGDKLEQAKNALKFCVNKLDERDRFNVVRFSTGFDRFFVELARADKENRAKAREKIDQFTAAGGTNIADALKDALDIREAASGGNASGRRPFVIVFITDGQGNQTVEETMKMVKNHRNSEGARIFPFGVGHDVNTILLDQLATNYNGKPTYVQPGENLELVLGDFFSVISQPVLTDLRLTLPEIDATEKFPASLGDLYHGQQLILAGMFDSPTTGEVKLRATRNGQPVEYVWKKIAFTHTAEAKYVPSIWAGRKISYLIDQIRAHGEKPEMVQEVIALSQEYGIQTPYSSWLVNPEGIRPLLRTADGGAGLERPDFAWQRGQPSVGGRGGAAGYMPSASRDVQRRALETSGNEIASVDDLFSLAGDVAAGDLDAASGEAATRLAERNAQLRESKSKDEGGRLNQAALLARKIGEKWYNRIGQFLVDEDFNEKSDVTKVKFGSNAYFDLVTRRPELRAALAASRDIVVMLDDTHAIVIAQQSGIDEFTEDQLKLLELASRKN
jgi:Ca-activated chloride channel family protein